MPHGKSKIIPYLIAFVDCILLLAAVIVANYIKFNAIGLTHNFYYYLMFGWLVMWILIGLRLNLFRTPRVLYLDKILYQNFKAILIFIILSTTIIFFSSTFKFSRLYFLIFNSIFLIAILFWRMLFWQIFKKYRRNGHNYREILLVGYNKNMKKVLEKVYLNPNFGYQIEGLFTDSELKSNFKTYYKGKLEDIFTYLNGSQKIYEIVISLPHYKSNLINELLDYADKNLIRVRIIPEFSEYLSHIFHVDYVENIPIMRYRNEPLNGFFNRAVKRFCDFSFSLITIIFIFSWLFPIIAIIIKLTSNGPVFFIQKRTGRDGKSFNCYKFRSMKTNGEADNMQACKNDQRITKFGAFMRKTSVDELPQIINVLFNQMSLVGPRPHMLSQTDEYKEVINNFMVRHFAKPGLTGWAQIKGFRGETKEINDMKNRVDADIWYIENWNFMLDIKIIFLTIWMVLFKKEENAF